MFKKILKRIYDLDKRIYCVRRCGFYKGSYTIQKKSFMIKRKEYDDLTSCNGLPWVAFEGSKWECKLYVDKNQLDQGLDRT